MGPDVIAFVFRLAWTAALLVSLACGVRAEPLIFYASQSGAQTLDAGEGGGNPFASAFIETLQMPHVELAELPTTLARLTFQKSAAFQIVEGPKGKGNGKWQLVPRAADEQRIALVMVVSDYTRAQGAQSLPGAERDARRVAEALHAAGFSTEITLDATLPEMQRKLAEFGRRSEAADAAVIYTTGHGVEVDGMVYLLPGDFPASDGNSALTTRALRISEIAGSVRARKASLILYGGCRDNPFKN